MRIKQNLIKMNAKCKLRKKYLHLQSQIQAKACISRILTKIIFCLISATCVKLVARELESICRKALNCIQLKTHITICKRLRKSKEQRQIVMQKKNKSKCIRKFSSDAQQNSYKNDNEDNKIKRQSAKIERKDNFPIHKPKVFKCQKIYTIKGSLTSNDRSSAKSEAKDANTPSVRCKRIPTNISSSVVKTTTPLYSSSFK